MLGLPTAPGEAHLSQRRQRNCSTRPSLQCAMVKSLVCRGPTVLVLEDLHWSNPTSLRLTADIAHLAAAGPLLLLTTRRPEPDPGIGPREAELAADPEQQFLQVLSLDPIEPPDELVLARSLLGGDTDDEVLAFACQGADGNPLFLEERMACLIDTRRPRPRQRQRRVAGCRRQDRTGPRGARADYPLSCRPAEFWCP